MAAPLAHFDEDWQDFNEFQSGTDSVDRLDLLNSNVDGASPGPPEDLSDLDSGFSGELCSFRSMEDLVHDFDDKLTVCFRNYRTKTDNIAPVRPITEDSFLKDDEVWNALTDNYGNVMPVDWKTSHTRCLHLPTLHLSQQQDHQCLDVSDDEDLREQMDYHSIITSCLSEPLYTAEQVIEEIEEMMQESPDPDGEESSSRSDPSQRARSRSIASLEDRLRGLSVRELSEELEEVEAAVRRRGEELIEALALRDEEEEEKEVKNSFIQLLMQLQQRQKEHRDALRRSNNRRVARPAAAARTHTPGTLFTMVGLSSVIQNGLRQPFNSTGREKQYLTTVIPYEKKRGSPSVEDLQILTKILRAMRDDSEKVPSLLTDYILKALV